MMKLILLAILSVAATTLAFQTKPGTCPEIKDLDNFDIEKVSRRNMWNRFALFQCHTHATHATAVDSTLIMKRLISDLDMTSLFAVLGRLVHHSRLSDRRRGESGGLRHLELFKGWWTELCIDTTSAKLDDKAQISPTLNAIGFAHQTWRRPRVTFSCSCDWLRYELKFPIIPSICLLSFYFWAGEIIAFSRFLWPTDNYGCFIICENLPDNKLRRAAAILSRSPKLDSEKLEMMRSLLAKYDMFEEDMTEIMTCDV